MAKVYVADDEKNIRELLGTFLSNENLTVELFETGDPHTPHHEIQRFF